MATTREKLLEKQTTRYDAIRTENIRKERRYAKEWVRNWGFLAESEAHDAIVEKFCDGRSFDEVKKSVGAKMKEDVSYDPEKYEFHPSQWMKRVRDIAPKQKYIYQQATSHQIGWFDEPLEKFGVRQFGCRHATDIQAARRKSDEKKGSKP